MKQEEIVRQLRIIWYSPREPRMFKRVTGLRPIARAAGLSHMTVYRAIRTGCISAASAEVLGFVLERGLVCEQGAARARNNCRCATNAARRMPLRGPDLRRKLQE